MFVRFFVNVFEPSGACLTHEHVTGTEAALIKRDAEAEGKRVVLRPVRVDYLGRKKGNK